MKSIYSSPRGRLDIVREQTAPYRRSAFRFIDLFAGIGGMRMAFDRLGGQCVFSNEWDAKSLQTYIANFGNRDLLGGDIRRVSASDIPRHDLLLAGFPCQPFSIAGVSKKNALGRPHGFACETQGTLFFDIERIIKHHEPRAFLLENVKNLTSHDGGRTFNTVRRKLEDLGYSIDYRIVDARHWLPQHRERIFIVGWRHPDEFDFDALELPVPSTTLEAILHPEDGSESTEAPYTEGSLARVSSKYTLTANLWAYLQEYAEKHRRKGNGFGYGLVGRRDVARTLSARYYKDGSEILIRQSGKRPRRLTPRECARLMGFDRADSKFTIPVSDTQAYRQFGNAVAVPAVEAVGRLLVDQLFLGHRRDLRRPRQMRIVSVR